MKIRSKISPGIVSPGVLAIGCIAGIMAIAVISTIANTSTNNVSALTYSTDTDISFTFNPTLSISLSDTNINIDNLLPGLSSESSPITVHVNSNTPYGYSLFASVGNSTDYNTTSLTHEDSNIGNNAVFTSIATNASLPQLTTDNTWGYTYRTHNTNNTDNEGWSNYNGLPLYSTVDNNTSTNNPALLIDTKSPADSTESIDFKIAAKASTTQASGTYNNVINFYAVGKPEPYTIDKLHYMQDFKGLVETDKQSVLDNMPIGEQYQLIDNRDNKTYWLAKQADGNIWMTQNLDLCIGCEGTAELTSENTDLNVKGSGKNSPYTSLYSTDSNGVIKWSPSSNVTRSTTGDTIPTGLPTYDVPGAAAVDGGDLYVYTSNTVDDDTIFISLNECANIHSIEECTHYHIGDYYNYGAAIASSANVGGIGGSEAQNSICPAGWRLPGSGSFLLVLFNSGIISSKYNSASYVDNGSNNIRISPLYFVRGGYGLGSSITNRANYGWYWSRYGYVDSFGDRKDAYRMSYGAMSITGLGRIGRQYALSIRCLAR